MHLGITSQGPRQGLNPSYFCLETEPFSLDGFQPTRLSHRAAHSRISPHYCPKKYSQATCLIVKLQLEK